MPSRTSTSSPHAIDSKPRRRKSMTIPGQVSSESTAHQSCPTTFTGRTRKGRLRSPRVANNVVRFFSAFFIIGKNRPFCTRTTPALFFPHRPSGNTFVHSSLKNYSITGFKEGTQCLYLNIPQESPTMPVLTLSTQSKTGWMILIGMPWCHTIRAVQFKEEQLRRFDRCLAGEGKPHQLIPRYRYILRRHLRIDRSRNI